MKVVCVVFGLLTLLDCLSALNILGIFPHPGRSHWDSFFPLMKGLSHKGHNVTIINYFSTGYVSDKYREIIFGDPKESFSDLEKLISLESHDADSRIIKYMTPVLLGTVAELSCEAGYKSENVKKLLREDNKFDVVIVEFFNSDCFLALANKFNCPIISIKSSTFLPWTGYRFVSPDHPGYISNHFMGFSNKMSFLERVENTVVTTFHQLYYNFVMFESDKEIVKTYLGEEESELEKYIYNISLLLINNHFTLNLPRPLFPTIVEVAGIHIQNPKPLGENLEKWISEAKHGVIYFSLGSMIKAKTMRKEKLEAFNKAFKRLPQRVLWKWENDTMEGKADNVMIQKWMPQFDILSHPNVKAFINHGGLLGTIEAVHCGVPMVVMPQFGDQHTNAKAIEANGGGIILKMSEVTEESVYNALKQVLSPDFQQQAKELSERFKDRPLPPLETAIYWVEYVARHKGAPHMRTAAVGMPFYQYYLLDVIGFLLIVTGLLSYILYHILKYPVRGLMRNKTVKEKSS